MISQYFILRLAWLLFAEHCDPKALLQCGHKVFRLQGGTGGDADQTEEVNNSELVD